VASAPASLRAPLHTAMDLWSFNSRFVRNSVIPLAPNLAFWPTGALSATTASAGRHGRHVAKELGSSCTASRLSNPCEDEILAVGGCPLVVEESRRRLITSHRQPTDLMLPIGANRVALAPHLP
jgi:hypothetical protein